MPVIRIPIRRRPSRRASYDQKSKARTATRAADAAKQPPAPEQPNHSACPICQEPVGQPTADGITEAWASLPCGHAFGSGCIKTWLGMAEHPTCPICRLPMAHSCRHPVLPVLEPPPNRFSEQRNSSSSGSNSDGGEASGCSPPLLCSSPSSPFTTTNTTATTTSSFYNTKDGSRSSKARTEKWHWRGRKLSGLCAFCQAAGGNPWPLRLAVAVLKVVLLPTRRGRRIQMPPPLYYGEDEDDPWRIAFRTWWSQQEPRVQEVQEPLLPEIDVVTDMALVSTTATVATASDDGRVVPR